MDELQKLKKKLKALESRITLLEKATFPQEEKSVIYDTQDESTTIAELSRQAKVELDSDDPGILEQFLNWLSTDWLMKLGAFLLLLGLAWFIAYSFKSNWVSPILRVSLGMLAGAGIMTFGHFAIPKRPNPGKVLLTLGGIVMLISMFAARNVYDFFTPEIAFAFMFLVVAVMSILAVLHNARSIAITSLLGGAAVPILVNSSAPSEVFLLSYMFILNAGTLLIARLKGWRSMILISLFLTAVYGISFEGLHRHDADLTVWSFMAVYFAFFLISTFLAILKDNKIRTVDLLTSGLNSLLLLLWIGAYVPRESISLVLVGVVVLLALVSQALFKVKKFEAVYLHLALAGLFLVSATSYELDGASLVIALAVEALSFIVFLLYVLKRPKAANFASLLPILIIPLLFEHIGNLNYRYGYLTDTNPILNQDFFAVLIPIFTFGASAYFLFKERTAETESVDSLPVIQAVIATVLAVILLWISSENLFFSENLANGVALITYTIVGLSAWIYGTRRKSTYVKLAGNIFLGGVILHLLAYEVWNMSLLGRVVTFLAIGILLISTAFIENKNKLNSK